MKSALPENSVVSLQIFSAVRVPVVSANKRIQTAVNLSRTIAEYSVLNELNIGEKYIQLKRTARGQKLLRTMHRERSSAVLRGRVHH